MTGEVSLIEKLKALATQVAMREGVELYDLEFVGGSKGQGRAVRVFIDKPGGVGIQDCSNVSQGLNLLLDVEDVIPGGAYSLEVSSPGLERRLREERHFLHAIGKRVWVKTSSSMEAERVRKQATGTVEAVEGGTVHLQVDGKLLAIPLEIIEKAQIVIEWNSNKGQKKSAKAKQ